MSGNGKRSRSPPAERHRSADNGVWVVIEGGVYDVSVQSTASETKFIDDHPGGKKILLNVAGTDATSKFWQFHSQKVLDKTAKPFLIGSVEGSEAPMDTEQAVEKQVEQDVHDEEEEDTTYYGDLVPFGDWASPYYNDSHRKVRSAVRKFTALATPLTELHGTETYLTPNAFAWDEAKAIPASEYKRVADAGILAAIAAGGTGWPSEYAKGIPVPGGINAHEWDSFHNLIVLDELSRCGSGGILYGIVGGFGISIGPLLHFGSDELKDRVVIPLLRGEKRSCLAITEPEGGSDVANIVTTARKTPDGKHYIVNGVTAVRTGGKGMGGISLLVVERTEGVTTRRMDCMGVWASGTTFVTFEDVKVPVENLLGRENKGFQLIMANFNGERAGIAIQANRFARVCLEESIKYASKRKTFGKRLIDHPVIRAKVTASLYPLREIQRC
ncbi:SPOSA6832_02004 [Sporobolomyces salmonicolor]|uniref:SPOSA6832_02004-mRNA-1:cds n=1 Tax=Sporidiobolus salmonicolor TaxID=5005 RepID=A0A0D6EK61_SPOSA|nr:SPOSA6832_02004 [Sporobolomyces salmonicolor]